MFLVKTHKAGQLKGAMAAIGGIEGATSTMELLPNAMLIRVLHPSQNIFAVLKMKSSAFYHYSCNRPYFVDFNIHDLLSILSSIADDDVLTISAHDPTTSILFKFENLGTRQSRQSSIRATETSSVHWTTDESAYQYCVVLPSPDFQHKFKLFKLFDDTVKITMTEKVVKLVAGLVAVILRKEAGECVIQGITGETTHKMVVSLIHFDAFWKASCLTSAVYIYDSFTVPPLRPLISCPLGPFGSIMFYLPRPFYFFPTSSATSDQ